MAHPHSILDMDALFSIDAITRQIANEPPKRKLTIVQNDHNSERFTFTLPRYIEGHDMTLCNRVEVHYINIDDKTKKEATGLYVVEDLKIKADEEEKAVCSWLISRNATGYAGKLAFLLRFMCLTTEGDETIIDYAWHTAPYSDIYVTAGIDASEVFETEYVEIIDRWKASVMAHFAGVIADDLTAWKDKTGKEVRAEAFADIDAQRERIDFLSNYVTPEMFGAKGDGVTDDTKAIRAACDSGKAVVMKGEYSVNGTIEVKNKIVLDAGATVYVDADTDIFAMNGEKLLICGYGTIQVRVDNYSHTVITMGGGCKRCAIEGIFVKGIDPYNCYGTGIACVADTARLFLNRIHVDVENFDIGILLDARNHWLNCFDIKAAVNYCDIGVKQIGNYENGYHTIDITGQACFYTENGCGLHCGENGGKCHYRLNIVDTGRVEGSVKYNAILAIIKSDNNCIEIPYASYGIYLKNEGRKNRFINEPEYAIAASDNILNNIDGETWCKYEPINDGRLTGANLFSYPKAKNTADYMLRYVPQSDNDGARITLTLPRAINPSVLGVICPMNQIPKRMVITFGSNNGTETIEIPSQVYEEGVFLPLTRYFTWKPLYQTKSITIECYGSNRAYDGQGAGLVGLMLNDNLLGGQLT